MPRPPREIQRQQTRAALLEAAGEVFGAQGFQAASLRVICKKAGANVALVKYYFGDKEKLYEEVVRFSAYCTGASDFPPEVLEAGQLEPAARLQKYISYFMQRLLDTSRPVWHRKLIARELMEPSGLMDRLARNTFEPHYRLLASIVSDILGPCADRDRVRLCAGSVLGQILFYQHSRAYIEMLAPDVQYTPRQIDLFAAHIFAFSLAALEHQRTMGLERPAAPLKSLKRSAR